MEKTYDVHKNTQYYQGHFLVKGEKWGNIIGGCLFSCDYSPHPLKAEEAKISYCLKKEPK
jgi:hypothetical protein